MLLGARSGLPDENKFLSLNPAEDERYKKLTSSATIAHEGPTGTHFVCLSESSFASHSVSLNVIPPPRAQTIVRTNVQPMRIGGRQE